MSENIKTRKYYRVHNGTDWDRMHFVTDANSVDANDGDNMETKVGAIKGITTSTSVTEEGYAADATTVAALNDSLGGLRFGTDGEGNYGYFGADDSLIPFSSSSELELIEKYLNSTEGTITNTLNITKTGCLKIIIATFGRYSSFQHVIHNGVELTRLYQIGHNTFPVYYYEFKVSIGDTVDINLNSKGDYGVKSYLAFM